MKFWFSQSLQPRLHHALLLGSLSIAGLTSCYTSRPPSGAFPGLYSTTTGLHNLTSEFGASRPIFDDGKAITYLKSPCGVDTSLVVNKDWAALKSIPHILPIGMPGCILLTKDGWGIDESEVPNIEWKRYQQQLAATGGNVDATQLATSALPVSDYFTNVFYDYYPVVGVSYEQAVAFCKWRGKVISYMLNRDKIGSPDSTAATHIVVESRLPTEAEWEQAALVGRHLPYGSKCLETPVEVNPKAAPYFKQRSGSIASLKQIQDDIEGYNKSLPARSSINYNQPEPYFMRLPTPAYVYGGLTNDYKLFNLLGNVAEMIQERGIAKGGSYHDALAACTVTSRSQYSSPSSTIGFRCITRATRPNQQ